MGKSVAKLTKQIGSPPDRDRPKLVDAILAGLDRPDPAIDRVWAAEARKRWSAYKAGCAGAVPYAAVMAKHRPA